ncbi:MAG: TRAP transporter large permease subunit [Betaproteobacteria bacterium]|nr:TRAP transporter large permease subunit [Betaproteobacteria bacterium]
MSDPALGMLMLGLIVVVIMMGFPTAFTLMGLGMVFGFYTFFDAAMPWYDNKIFNLMVQRTFGAMTNDTLLSIPLFVLMGYVMERGALVDKMFYSVQLAFRRLPGSLAIATLVICTFWGIASGLVGAVVVLMGVIALRPMLNAGYDTRLAAGVITAGGTLGILIPPSVMIIVYAAVAGQSVVKLYAAAMFPGFFLALLYLAFIIIWVLIKPDVAPKLPPDQMKAPIRPWVSWLSTNRHPNMIVALLKAVIQPTKTDSAHSGCHVGSWLALKSLVMGLTPIIMTAVTLGLVWWYVVIHSAPEQDAFVPNAKDQNSIPSTNQPSEADGREGVSTTETQQQPTESAASHIPEGFFEGFLITCALSVILLAWYYKDFDAEQFEIVDMLVRSVMPLGVLTLVVLGVILFGITTATESAAVGAAGAFLMAWRAGSLDLERIKQSVFLTAKTTSMVCWLFVGSALFSAVFALLGGQRLVEEWVISMNLTPLQFMLLSQAIIFILGWPLEWTEIIVIFVPIFLPLLDHFKIDPMLWGVMVFVNLQAAFLSPPVAMSAFYLKGVSPPGVTINQIFAGMMPYMLIVILCLVLIYVWPELVLWLPTFLYGR